MQCSILLANVATNSVHFVCGDERNLFLNKKVLLREHKKHTACRVASTTSAVLSWGGVPHPWLGGYPSWDTPQEMTWDQWKYYGMEMGIPPPGVDRRHLWKQYLPVVLRTRAVNTYSIPSCIHYLGNLLRVFLRAQDRRTCHSPLTTL